MASDIILDWAKVLAVLGGVCIGIFAVYSPSWVWLRKQIFGWGSAVLCAFGTILIVASIFRNVTFVVDIPKFEFRLAEIKADILQTKNAVAGATDRISQIALEVANSDSTKTATLARLETVLKEISARNIALEEKLQTVATEMNSQIATVSRTLAGFSIPRNPNLPQPARNDWRVPPLDPMNRMTPWKDYVTSPKEDYPTSWKVPWQSNMACIQGENESFICSVLEKDAKEITIYRIDKDGKFSTSRTDVKTGKIIDNPTQQEPPKNVER